MSDQMKDVLDKGKDWISEKDNQEKVKSISAKIWSWIKGRFSKK